ncbi:MAG: MFS transporter [Acidiferrobacteraceae bacterium]|nr:MFS transporter [Acidiferrobacteraceae bacterium]
MKKSNRWLILSGVWLLYVAFGVSATSLAPLVAVIESDLDIQHSAMGVILGAWQFVFILAALPSGILLDRFGSRNVLAIGGLLISVSLLGRSIVDNYLQLLLFVSVFGLGGPIISTGAPKVVAEWFDRSERGIAMGIYITGPGIGAIISLTMTNSVLMPWLDGDWQLVLRFWGWFALASALIWILIARSTKDEQKKEVNFSNNKGVTSALLQIPSVRIVLIMGIGVLFITHGLSNWLPELLRFNGLPIDEAGVWAAIPVAVSIISALIIPRLAIPKRRIKILLVLFLCTCLATIFLRNEIGIPLTIGLLLDGLGRSTMMTVLILTLVEIKGVGENRAGTASGLFFTAAEIGGVAGPITLGIFYDFTGMFSMSLNILMSVALLLIVLLGVLKKHEKLP